jgi:hypothetical protein
MICVVVREQNGIYVSDPVCQELKSQLRRSVDQETCPAIGLNESAYPAAPVARIS